MQEVIQFDRNGETGNIFYILREASSILKAQGRVLESVKMFERVKKEDYDQALAVIGEYVKLQDITYKPRYQPRTYEQLIQFSKDAQISQEWIVRLLRYYTDTLGWGMQESLDYVVGLFENGTIQEIKKLGGL